MPIVCFQYMYGLKPVPFSEQRRTSGAKALIIPAIYGTAEAVPFVQSSFLAGKAYWMDWRLVSSSHADSKALLSPSVSCGTAEAVPFVK